MVSESFMSQQAEVQPMEFTTLDGSKVLFDPFNSGSNFNVTGEIANNSVNVLTRGLIDHLKSEGVYSIEISCDPKDESSDFVGSNPFQGIDKSSKDNLRDFISAFIGVAANRNGEHSTSSFTAIKKAVRYTDYESLDDIYTQLINEQDSSIRLDKGQLDEVKKVTSYGSLFYLASGASPLFRIDDTNKNVKINIDRKVDRPDLHLLWALLESVCRVDLLDRTKKKILVLDNVLNLVKGSEESATFFEYLYRFMRRYYCSVIAIEKLEWFKQKNQLAISLRENSVHKVYGKNDYSEDEQRSIQNIDIAIPGSDRSVKGNAIIESEYGCYEPSIL